jgi:hypothetical protein
MHGASGKTSLLHEFAAAARGRILARLDEPGRQFPGKALQCRTVLPDDGNAAIRQRCDDGDVILLDDRVIEFSFCVRSELNLALDDCHPRRDARDLAGFDLRPILDHGSRPVPGLARWRF